MVSGAHLEARSDPLSLPRMPFEVTATSKDKDIVLSEGPQGGSPSMLEQVSFLLALLVLVDLFGLLLKCKKARPRLPTESGLDLLCVQYGRAGRWG